MAAALWKTATSNAFSTTLNGGIGASDTSITLTSVSGLQFPGILVLDRQDGNGTNTPTKREYISYTGITSLTLTGVTRGVAGSTAQSHNSGALVEETFSTTHWVDLVSFLQTSHNASGDINVSSTATIATLRVPTYLNASGASISGNFPIHPGWVVGATVSLATTSVGKPFPVAQSGLWTHFCATVLTPVSGASLVLDINKNGTTIFTDQAFRLAIPGGGTFVSTASIAVRSFSPGDFFSLDIDNGGGTASGLTVYGKGV